MFMALNETEQIKKLLEDKKDILITFHPHSQGDAIASAAALALYLEKLGKRVEIVSAGFVAPQNLKFLKKIETIKSSFPHLQKFVITVDVEKTGLNELSYDLKDNRLRLFITPRAGFLNRDNLRTAQSDFKYDLIFVLDTQDLSGLGALYDNNTELFFSQPIINLDHHSANEHFGQVNLIDTTATATGELLYKLLTDLGPEHISEEVATALLTSIIANTKSFKTHNIKPRTLYLASRLMGLGADREHIVQNLYRTLKLSTLKLWGKALSNLEQERSLGLVWTSITRDDFVRSGAHAHELYNIVEEIIRNSPEAKLILLFHEQSTDEEGLPRIHVILDADKNYNAAELLKPFGLSTGDKKQATAIVAGKTLKETQEEIVNHIKNTAS